MIRGLEAELVIGVAVFGSALVVAIFRSIRRPNWDEPLPKEEQ